MPLYSYACDCGLTRDVFKPLAQLNRAEHCNCGDLMSRRITAAAVVTDYAPYSCPISGKMIEGRQAHRENLARTGCRILEPGESAAAARYRAAEEAKLDAAVEQTAGEFVEALPQQKREALESALHHGFDATVVRQ